jgi:hypothetical protein
MNTTSNFLFSAIFVLALLLIAAQGGLACFWQQRWRAVRARLPRACNPDSPGGRMMERYRIREATLVDRLGGAVLLTMAVGGLFWFVRHLLSGRLW